MTNPIVLKRTERSDANLRAQVLSKWQVSQNVFIDLPISITATEGWAQTIQSNSSRVDFTIFSQNSNGEVPVGYIGLVSISYRHGTAELYIFLDPDSQGQGIGSRALELTIAYAKHELNLRKIKLFISEPNSNLDKFYTRNGFEKEGELKSDVWFRGEYVNRSIYSIFTDSVRIDKNQLYMSLG